jgi:transposase
MKRYKVTLSSEERLHLQSLISKGKSAAQKLRRARILLKADESPGSPAWIDEQISKAVEVNISTVEKTRQAFVEEGMEAALNRKKPSRLGHQKFDGVKEAHLITLACSTAPEGRQRWTLQLLADKMVELKHFDSISHEAVRQVLKKTNLSLG